MAPLIVASPGDNVYISYTTAPAAVLNLSCYIIAVEITPSTEEIDVGTFCAPSLTDQGRTTFSAVLSLLWEPALYTLLEPHIGQQGVFKMTTNAPDQTDAVMFDTRYAAQPWGRFEVGQRVEVELPLAVLSTPLWRTDAP